MRPSQCVIRILPQKRIAAGFSSGPEEDHDAGEKKRQCLPGREARARGLSGRNFRRILVSPPPDFP